MNFLLIAPRYIDRDGQYYEFPLGLCYLSAVLKQQGYTVHCLNLNHFSEADLPGLLHDTIIGNNIEVVCTGGLSTHYNKIWSLLNEIGMIKKDLITIVGGGIISSEPELMHRSLGFDIGVIGEGEETLVELAGALSTNRDLADIPGLIFRNHDGESVKTSPRSSIIDLDSLPYPDYEGFGVTHYLELQRPNDNYYLYPFDKPRILPIISSRSCPFNCTFCFHPIGNQYRQRSLESFFKEVEYLVDTYQINMLAILDELFSFNEARLHEFCHRMKSFKLKWIAQMRVAGMSADTLALLKQSGLFYISYGIESASPIVLKSMKKHIRVEQLDNTLSLTREAGIGIQGNFLFGDPAETWETAMETLAWWKKNSKYQINLTPIIPYPGCQDYNLCVERGLIPDRLGFITSGCPSLNMTGMSDETYSAMFQAIVQATYENRIMAKVLSVDREMFDDLKGTPLYTLKTECPHCGSCNTYKNFHKDELEIFKLACRQCNQRYDMSSMVFSHIDNGVDEVRSSIFKAVQAGRHISITPFLPEQIFYQTMEMLGLNWHDMNITCVLDQDSRKTNYKFISKIKVLQRDRETVQTHCKDHLFIVLPCLRQKEITLQLREECGVDPKLIVPVDLGRKETTKPSITDTLKSINKKLAEYHPELPALLNMASRNPNSRFVTHGKQQAIQDLIDKLILDGRSKIGIIGNTGLLDVFLSFAAAQKFRGVYLIDDDRETSYYAQSFGVERPHSSSEIKALELDAVIIDEVSKTRTRKKFEELPRNKDCNIYYFAPQERVNAHRQFIAEQIAETINALKPDILYIGHFAYFNLCKQSMALRKKGKKTAILLQIPNNMEFKGAFFDAMFTNYEDDLVFCHILALLDVPLIHVQGWMTLSHLPLITKAAAKCSKIICEFNDISSLFASWSSFEKIWNKETARLERISEKALFNLMDGLVFNHNAPTIEALMEYYEFTLPNIGFHSYPEQEFFAEPNPAPASLVPGRETRLVFIGTLNSSNLPSEYFGDVKLLPLIKQIVSQKIYFDIFLLPYQAKNTSLWDYTYFDNTNAYFTLRSGLPPDKITGALAGYDYGVMFYRFDRELRVKPDHLKGILPTKFFTFMEAGIPVIVSEELEYVAKIVQEHGLGIVVSQSDIDSLQDIINRTDQGLLKKNIRAYRQENCMDNHITTMESFYDRVLAK